MASIDAKTRERQKGARIRNQYRVFLLLDVVFLPVWQIRACSFATPYIPSFFRMPARLGALVSAFLFVFMALWSSVGAECCGNSVQKFGAGGGTDCPCPTEPPCNLAPTTRITGLHKCNIFGCNCDECDATKLCPAIPADLVDDWTGRCSHKHPQRRSLNDITVIGDDMGWRWFEGKQEDYYPCCPKEPECP